MSDGPTSTVSRQRLTSVALSVAGLVFLVAGLLLSWSRLEVLLVPVALGLVALALAVREGGAAAARPGRAAAFVLSALSVVSPVATVAVVVAVDAVGTSASYTLTVDSPGPVDVVIRTDADQERARWDGGDATTFTSRATVVGIDARAATPTTVISCEIRRDGRTVAAAQRAGSVDCSVR